MIMIIWIVSLSQTKAMGRLEHLFSSALESRIHMMRYRRFFALGLEVSNFHSSSKPYLSRIEKVPSTVSLFPCGIE